MKIIGEFDRRTPAILIIALSAIAAILYLSGEGERSRNSILQGRLANTLLIKENMEKRLALREREFGELLKRSQQEEAQFARYSATIRDLEEKLALAAKEREGETIALEKIVIKPLPSREGRVLKVNPDYSFVVVDMGANSDIHIGDILSVYRQDEFIGRLVIEKVQDKYSAASVLPRWKSVRFKENDVVREL